MWLNRLTRIPTKKLLMNTFRYLKKITRPEQCLTAALATFVVALLSNGPSWFTAEKIAAPITIALSVLGASLWHYGARYDVYAKKHWDVVTVIHPQRLLFFGCVSFIMSVVVAFLFLPKACTLIAFINVFIIVFYARRLDQYWPWKNLVIALVCTSPLIIGWLSGQHVHSIVLPMIIATFFIYLAREILKDIQDREANHGLRFTMVMDIGVKASLRIAGAMLCIAILVLLIGWQYIPSSLFFAIAAYWISVSVLVWNGIKLLMATDLASRYKRIDIAVLSFLICILAIRISIF